MPKPLIYKKQHKNPPIPARFQTNATSSHVLQQYMVSGINYDEAPYCSPNLNPVSTANYFQTPKQPSNFKPGDVLTPIGLPNFEPGYTYNSPDHKLEAHILSLQDKLEKMENNVQRLNYTLEQTQMKSKMTSKNRPTNPTASSLSTLASPLKQSLLNKPTVTSLYPPPLFTGKRCQKEPLKNSGLLKLPVKSQNLCKDPKYNEKKSSMNIKRAEKNKKRSGKSQVETQATTISEKDKKIDDEKKEKTGGSVSSKDQKNSKKKGQSMPSTKLPCKDNQSETLNDFSVDKNRHHKSQGKLIKEVPLQCDLEKEDKKSKVWNLYVTINADIDITIKLPNILIERLKNKIKFEVKSVTKAKTTGYVRYLLGFNSKHQMTTAMRLFKNSNKRNAIKIDCKRVAEDKNLPDKPNIKKNKQKCQKNDVLQQHEKKIESVRKEITFLMHSAGDTFSSQETNSSRVKTLECKERELIFQLFEYKNAQKDLDMQLKKLPEVNKEDSREKEKIFKKLTQEQNFLSQALPLYAMRSKITETILNNKVTILMGNCGSGKTTQLIQYLMETSLIDEGPIVCTEPSEERALSLAKYVAAEVNSSLGDLVGFSSEDNIHLSINTNVLFISEHELLEQFQKMKSFSTYSCVMIDEAQERTVDTALLLSLLKQELSTIPRLRIIIITAPVEISVYQSFFTNSALIEVNSCLFPVQVFWEDQAQFHKTSAVEKALAVHHTEEEGDILVFVASIAEVIECCTHFKLCMQKENYVCLPLHRGLNYEQLKGIYKVSYKAKRKIIFTTDCAEVMIAVPNVRYVIDTGVKKERFLESGNKNYLPISFISQESSKHRKERAGSYFAGKCYRLYSQNDFKTMEATQPNEMYLDGSVEKVVMYLIKQEIDPMKFKFITSVLEERISCALRNLENLGAVLNDNGKYKMTDLGTRMSNSPFRLHMTWMLLEGIKQGIIMETVALMSLSDLKLEVFCTESEDNEMMRKNYQEFGQPCESIALRTLKVLKAWFQQPNKEKQSWCKEKFLNMSSIKLIISHMKDICKNLRTKLAVNVKFQENLPINNIKDLEKLIDESLNLTPY